MCCYNEQPQNLSGLQDNFSFQLYCTLVAMGQLLQIAQMAGLLIPQPRIRETPNYHVLFS